MIYHVFWILIVSELGDTKLISRLTGKIKKKQGRSVGKNNILWKNNIFFYQSFWLRLLKDGFLRGIPWLLRISSMMLRLIYIYRLTSDMQIID